MWFWKKKPKRTSFDVEAYKEMSRRAHEAGCINGRHYTTYAEDVKQLKREGKLVEAEKLLLKLIKAVEAQAQIDKLGVAPWYYNQLGIVYRKMGDKAKADAIAARYENWKK